MCNHSFTTSRSNVLLMDFTVDIDAADGLWARAVQCLLIAMEQNSIRNMTLSEEQVLSDLRDWVLNCLYHDLKGLVVPDASFSYVNLSTGANQLLLWTDAKGQIQLKSRMKVPTLRLFQTE